MSAARRPLRRVQIAWGALAVASTALFAVPLALAWAPMQAICHPESACAQYQLDAAAAGILHDHGVSPLGWAIYNVALLTMVWVIWYGLAAVIVWRKPDDRGAVLSAFFLVLFPAWQATYWVPSAPVFSDAVLGVSMAALFFFCLLFPSGRFAPPWARRLVPVAIIGGVGAALGGALGSITWLVAVIVVVALQIHRYRSASSWAERQQTKWAFFGLVMAVLGIVALVIPFIAANVSNQSLYSDLTLTLLAAVGSAIPVSIGIAVLRNRLWDIDRVINRALVYSALTISIAAIYTSGVIGLQALFRLVAGQQSTLAIALSTLAIAGLFGPLRRRIQSTIDRRFYRRKYDAAQTLASLTARLRDEVDLTHLKNVIVSVVADTMQPAHVSLWLPQEETEVPD